MRQQFTAKERDVETGLDFFEARYFGSLPGRFTSPDPYNIILDAQATAEINPDKAKAQFLSYLSQPQNWNRYTYVINNPLKYIDPTGELLELTGSEEDKKKAFERIKELVGSEGAKYLGTVEMCTSSGHCGTYVFYTGGDMSLSSAFVNSSKLNAFIGEIIESEKTVEFRVATSFDTKYEKGVLTAAGRCGGACTVGAEESLTGNTQIFVNADSGNIAQERFNTIMNQAYKVRPTGQLDFYDDIVDAHEFGHGYANAIEGKAIRSSDATNPRSLEFENLVRERRGMTRRRIAH